MFIIYRKESFEIMKKKISFATALILALTIVCLSTVSAGAVSYQSNVDTTSSAVYMVNMDTNTVVFDKASTEKRYPASLTKIMTFIVTSEEIANPDNTKIQVKQTVLDQLAGTDSSVAGLYNYVGEEFSVTDLLYCLMVSSGNDAAVLLADYIGNGDQQVFVDKMNAKAKQLGMNDTHFANPHGLQDEDHYTTAADIYKMASYAVTLPNFTQITNTTSYTLVQGDTNKDDYVITTTNKLINPNDDMYYQYAKGIKTGTTDEAGYCLVSTAVKDGYAYMCIALGAPCYDDSGKELENGAAKDSKNLYEWAFSALTLKSIVGENDPVCEVKVNYAWGKDTTLLTPEYSYSTIMPADAQTKDIKIDTNVPESVDTPIKEGQVIGTATISYNGEELTKVNLVADEAIEKSDFVYTMAIAKNVVTSIWFIIAVIIIVLLFIGYIILVAVTNKKDKERKEKM